MLTDDEHRFLHEAEREMLACLRAFDAIASPVDPERRMVIEASLLLKMLVLIVRDGLEIRDGARLAATLMEVWHDEEERGE